MLDLGLDSGEHGPAQRAAPDVRDGIVERAGTTDRDGDRDRGHLDGDPAGGVQDRR